MTQTRTPPTLQHIDVPQLPETFADAVHGMVFDGQTVRVELCVTRMEETDGAERQVSGKRYTACRLVLTPGAALQLSSKLAHMVQAMVQQAAPRKPAAPEPAQARAG